MIIACVVGCELGHHCCHNVAFNKMVQNKFEGNFMSHKIVNNVM